MLHFKTAATAAIAATILAVAARAADAPVIPVGVPIPVELTRQITSQTAHVGDTFWFKTTHDETLGTLRVPYGTPGTGRLAVVKPAEGKAPGSLSLQADELQLATGELVWVNIDTSKAPMGHLADRHTKLYILPLPIGIIPGTLTTVSGNMVLEPGTAFRVLTVPPRKAPAVLLTAPPAPMVSPSPASPPGSSPSPNPT